MIKHRALLANAVCVLYNKKPTFSPYYAMRCFTNNITNPPNKLKPNYGLHIHQLRLIGGEESTTKISIYEETTNTVHTLRKELDSINWFSGDAQLLSNYKSSVDQILNDLLRIKTSIHMRYSYLPPATGPIQQSIFDFRGMFLTIRSTMEVAIEAIRNQRDKIEKHSRMMHVLSNLTQMGTILTEEREKAVETYRKHQPGTVPVSVIAYPFSDSIDINKYEMFKKLDAVDYFEEIGQQFAPMMRLFLSLMVSVTASHNASLGYHPLFRRGIFYASNLYYLLNSRQAAQKTNEFMATLTTKAGKDLWTMPDTNKLVRTLSFLSMPDIEISATFTIPFRKESAKETSQRELKEQDREVTTELRQKQNVDATVPLSELIGESSMEELDYYNNQIPKIVNSGAENARNDIHIRLISANPLPSPTTEASLKLHRDYPSLTAIRRYGKIMVDFITGQSHSKQNRPGFIFHIHGGGFIALSSFAHECYLRPWAIDTQLPIFSVDYSKTPDYHYPVQLEECYQAYKWILENGEAMGINTEKIVFAGDSAGGNLALAVLIRVIKEGLQKPDAIVLTYPATYLQFSASPARVVSLLDPLLNFKLLELCGLEYYLNPNSMSVKNNAQRNALISPCVVPEQILKQFPRMYLNVGALDPLFDDSIYLAKRMEEANGPESVRLEIYDSLAHGYLNLIDFIPEVKTCSKRISEWINNVTSS
jgi:acetyl esterase/lipase